MKSTALTHSTPRLFGYLLAGTLLLGQVSLKAQQSSQAPAVESSAPKKEISDVGQRRLRKLSRATPQPRLYKNGVERPADIAVPPMAQKPEQRWLPGYRPGTPQAIEAYENWKREQAGLPPVQTTPSARPGAKGKKHAVPGAPGANTPPGVTLTTAECKAPKVGVPSTPATGIPALNENGPAENHNREIPIGRQNNDPQPAPSASTPAPQPAPSATKPRTPGEANEEADLGIPEGPQANTEGRLIVNPSVPAGDVQSLANMPYVPANTEGFRSKQEGHFLNAEQEQAERLRAKTLPPTVGMQHAAESKTLSAPFNPKAPTPAGANFDGPDASVNGGYPPDPILAVGPNHVLAAVNVSLQIFNKSGVRLVNSTFATLFSGQTNCNGTSFLYDPWVDYDEANDRWVVGVDRSGNSTGTYLCVAASKTADPTQGWYTYAFDPNINNPTLWLDNADLAIGLDAIYIGGNLFTDPGVFTKSMVYALNKTSMYAGTAANFVEFDAGGTFFNPNPATIRGYGAGQWPAAGTPMYIPMSSATQVRILAWTNPFAPTAPTTYGTLTFATAATIPPAVPQPAPGLTLDGSDYRINDAEYRNGKLWIARGSGCNPGTGIVACVQWAEINVTGASPVFVQQNIYGSNGIHRSYPDLAVDRNNSMAVGFTHSSTTAADFPGVYVTGRDTSDPINTLQADATIKVGDKLYDDGSGVGPQRWGDYTGMTIDPDGCRFWYLGEYSKTGLAAPNWGTRIASFKFASCSTASSINLNKSVFTCSDSMTITLNDVTATPNTWPASQVVITSSTGDSETIPAGNWTGSGTCAAGSCTIWTATIPVNSAVVSIGNGTINSADGGTVTVTYNDTHPTHTNQVRTVSLNCQPTISDGGYTISGGCDVGANGPEKYTAYMDNGELIAYTSGIFNQAYSDLTDVRVAVAISGAGAGNLTLLGPSTINVGRIAARSLAGAVFNFTVTGAAPITPVTLTFSITSPADGYTTPFVITQPQFLQADDAITQQQICLDHNTADMTARINAYSCGGLATAAGPWSQINTASCGSENRIDGCGNATAGMYKTATCASTFNTREDEVLFATPFQPINRGDFAPNIPWRYAWKLHSTYGSSQTVGNTSGIWGAFYHNDLGSAVVPANGNAIDAFPISVAYYYQTIWDVGVVGAPAWDWDVANTGTPNSFTVAPPNQLVLDMSGINGLSLAGTYFEFGHEHLDLYDFSCTGTNGANNRGIGIDNDNFVWDEYHTTANAGSCTTQCGNINFDKFEYGAYPSQTVTLTILDSNAGAGPLTATVVSGVGDSETVTLTKVVGEPRYVGTITLYLDQGNTSGDGKLFALPTDTLTATYNDASDGTAPCTGTATASVNVPSGDLVYVSNAISTNALYSNGDLDTYADTNETVSMSVTLKNNMTQALTNVSVRVSSNSPNIDCVAKDTASFGTINAGATATNAVTDQFKFHVKSTTDCVDFKNPPTALFTVYVSGTNIAGAQSLQTFSLNLDLNTFNGPAYTYTQDFTSNPGWTVGVGPGDGDGVCPGQAYVNDFKYTATNGRAGGGYTAWQTDVPFGTTGRYRPYSDSVLYSPVFVATAAPTLTFDRAVGTSAYHGAGAAVSVNGGAWTTLAFTAPTATVAYAQPTAYCNPLATGDNVWVQVPPASTWGTTNTVTIAAVANDTFQFRWRLGSDSTASATRAFGFGVDNVVVTNVKQTVACDATNNSALPGCAVSCSAPTGLANNTAADASACAASGITVTWTAPTAWGDTSGTRTWTILRDGTPIAAGPCSGAIAETTLSCVDTPGDAASHAYTVRANNGCGMNAVSTGASAADASDTTAPTMTTQTLAKASPNINFTWTSAEAGANYTTYSAATPNPGSWTSRNTTTGFTWSNATDLGTGTSVFFTTTAKDACLNESPK